MAPVLPDSSLHSSRESSSDLPAAHMSQERSLLKPNVDTTSGKISLKSKLRAISRNRHQHKTAHFEPDEKVQEYEPPQGRPSSEARPDSIDSTQRRRVMDTVTPEKRGRSQGRQDVVMDGEKQTSDTMRAASGGSALSQPQLASPILSTPIITGTDYAPMSTPNKLKQTFVPTMDEGSFLATTDTTQASPAPGSAGAGGGFLSSMLNAATSLGTALSSGNPRSPPMKSGTIPESDHPSILTPVRAPVGYQTELSGPTVATLGLGELSVKDIGLLQSPGVHSEAAPSSRARGGTLESNTGSLQSTDVGEGPKVHRSGSVNTSHSRKRRGSTSVPIFGAEGQGQKITGFAVASNKRNREFHGTFRSVPEADYLLDDYGCALQKEILVHGRMYVSESHICFNSNIFGWVTNLVIAFTDIISVEKRSTAGIFPNAIQISTLHAKHFFASFISRETTYDLIVNIWRLTHPSIQTTATGVTVAEEGDDIYNSDLSESVNSDTDSVVESIDIVDRVEDDTGLLQLTSHSSRDSPNITATSIASPETVAAPETGASPGPKEHAPTEAPSLHDGTAYPKHLLDECFQAPLGQVYELLYGSDINFLQDFLITNQKLLDVQVNQFTDRGGKNVRSMSYVKPLNSPVGPKQTRCLLEDVIEMKDFEKCVQVVQSTTSPDVPSGDNFVIKTRFSLMWGPNNTTRLVSNCAIEWSKNSWLKGPIEKGANNGQMQFMADLSDAIKAQLNSASPNKVKKSKNRKTRSNTKDSEANVSDPLGKPVTQQSTSTSGGMLGPLSGLIDNININALILVLLFGMMLSIVRLQRTVRDLSGDKSRPLGNIRLAETQWQHEEADLWTWLADRTVDTTLQGQSGMTHGDPQAAMNSLQIQEALKHQVAVLKLASAMQSEKTSPAK